MQTLRCRFKCCSLIICILLFNSCCQSPAQTVKKRDPYMRKSFLAQNPCPSTGKTKGACPGYIVDHIVPIKRGGGDHPYNMQWQSVQDAKDKDRWE